MEFKVGDRVICHYCSTELRLDSGKICCVTITEIVTDSNKYRFSNGCNDSGRFMCLCPSQELLNA